MPHKWATPNTSPFYSIRSIPDPYENLPDRQNENELDYTLQELQERYEHAKYRCFECKFFLSELNFELSYYIDSPDPRDFEMIDALHNALLKWQRVEIRWMNEMAASEIFLHEAIAFPELRAPASQLNSGNAYQAY